jgi:hypothetical protein
MRLSLCWIAVLGLSLVSEPAAAQERDFCASSLLGEAAPLDLVPSMLPSSPSQDPGEKAKTEDKEAPAALQKTSNDRILWTLPNFLTMENADSIPALSPSEKFKVTARGVFDPFEFVLVSFVAGLNQASDSNPTYGQGMQGYAKRYGTAYADNAIENFMASAVFPSVLHQDPRYYQLGQGGFLRRSGHAVSRVLITRSDSGRKQLNSSELGGGITAAAISTYAYHPESERGFGNVLSVWGSQMGWDAVTYMIKEFWPDLRKRSRNRKQDLAVNGQTSNSN